MAAQAEGPLNAFAHTCFRRRVAVSIYGSMVLLVVVVGVLSLIAASHPRQMLESWINIHALFGLLLCCLALARGYWLVKHSPPILPAEVREFSRHLSRIVYLLLYVVIALRQIIGILTSLWNGGALDFNLFDVRFHDGPDSRLFDPKDDFQLFLASGLVALVTVRVLVFRMWLRSVKRAELSQAAPGLI